MVAIFASLLALANRKFVTVNFDPIPPASEGWSIEAPLFLVILGAMFLGILIGGFAVWLNQRRLRPPTNDEQLRSISEAYVAPHRTPDQVS